MEQLLILPGMRQQPRIALYCCSHECDEVGNRGAINSVLVQFSCVLAASLVAIVFWLETPARGEISDARFYGDNRQVSRQIASELSVRWEGVPLRDALNRLGQTQQIAVWLDRRADPNVEISLDARVVSLGDLLEQVAVQAGLGLSASRNLVYLGPPETAAELRTHWAITHQQIESMNAALRDKMLRQASLSLPRLYEPREVIIRLAERMGIRIENIDSVPYDLRPAARLPKMAAAEQLTLMLLEFDLTWEPLRDRRSVRLVPVEWPTLVQRVHPREVRERLSDPRFHELYPDAEVRPAESQNKMLVVGLVEQHELLLGKKGNREVPQPRRPQSHQQSGKQVYSLRVDEQPAGTILRQLSEQLQLQLTIDETADLKAALQRRVTFEVREASLNELLGAISKEADLSIRVERGTIRVSQ
ncbi:MAG: hypothetical protein ACR2NU_10255 [Aeoliella sp.]